MVDLREKLSSTGKRRHGAPIVDLSMWRGGGGEVERGKRTKGRRGGANNSPSLSSSSHLLLPLSLRPLTPPSIPPCTAKDFLSLAHNKILHFSRMGAHYAKGKDWEKERRKRELSHTPLSCECGHGDLHLLPHLGHGFLPPQAPIAS